MKRLARLFDRTTQAMEQRYLGKPATYVSRSYGDVDVTTGVQTILDSSKSVTVRPWPISVRELESLSQAGLTQVETRWCMRAHHIENVEPGDIIKVSGFSYEVLDQPASVLDEFGVDWIIYARRMRL